MTPQERDGLVLLYAAKIELARAARTLSQAKLARLADTDPVTLNKFLAGADVRVTTFIRIAEAAGFDVVLQPKLRQSA